MISNTTIDKEKNMVSHLWAISLNSLKNQQATINYLNSLKDGMKVDVHNNTQLSHSQVEAFYVHE